MANIKVSEMTEATSFDDGDYTMIVQANQNKKISKENMLGDIEGDISTISDDISTINTNIGDLTNSYNDLRGQILWVNDDPTVNFNGQTVTLNSSNYDILEIIYIDYRANQRMQSIKIQKGKNANLNTVFLTGNQLYMATRQMDYVDDTHYTFDNCHSVTNTAITALNTSSPAQCIPMLIIGYKTELFNNEGE